MASDERRVHRTEWRRVATVVIGFLFSAAALIGAQGRTVTLYGKVTDQSGAVLPGATVTVTSPQLIKKSESAVSDSDGRWRIAALPPGIYTVTAELPGFATVRRERIAVDAGEQLSIDLTLGLTTVQETLTVKGESPVVDVRSTALAHTVGTELIKDVPIQRTYADVINMMPGITDGGKYTYSLTQTVHGSSVRDNDYMIDGQSMKHPSGYAGTEFSIEALEQVRLTTGGMSAEFGQASGGVFTFITKSGGDQFSGTAYGYIIDDKLQSDNLSQQLIDKGVKIGNAVLRDTNWGGNLGGPIKRQKLWFFGDFTKSDNESTTAGFPGSITEVKRLTFVKGTYQVSTNNRLMGSYNRQYRWMNPSNPGSEYRVDPRAWRKQYWLPKVSNLQWTSVLGAHAIWDAQIGKLKVIEDNTFPNGSYDPSEINGYADTGSGVRYGTWDRQRGRFGGRDHWDVKSNFSYFAGKFLGGSHDVKTGFHREKGWSQRWDVIPNNFVQMLNSPATCLSLTCAIPSEVTLFDLPSDTQQEWAITAVYLQDQWSLPRNLTINAGVRFEHSNGWTPEFRTGADLEPEGFNPDLEGNKVDFPTIAWFPSKTWPARKDLIVWNTLAPRLGVSWDPSGNSRFVLKGSYGRWYNKLAAESVGTGHPAGGTARYTWLDCRNAAGAAISCQGLSGAAINGDKRFQASELGNLVTTSVRDPSALQGLVTHDPNLKQPYVDAVSLGFEVGLGSDLSVGVSGIYKRQGNILGTIDPTRRPFETKFDPVQVTNPVTGQPMTIYLEKPELGAVPTQSLLSNPPGAKGTYRGLELIARKRFSDRWQLYSSYTLGRSEGNVGTHYNDGIGYNVRSPNALINSVGPLSLDATHQIKVNGSYQLPYELNLAVSYLGITGYPAQPLVSEIGGAFPGATYFQFVRGVNYPATNAQGVQYREARILLPVEPRGTHRVDFRNLINMRVEKTFTVARHQRVGVMLDVFNLLNIDAVTQIQTQRIELVNSGLPEAIELPFRARLGLRYTF